MNYFVMEFYVTLTKEVKTPFVLLHYCLRFIVTTVGTFNHLCHNYYLHNIYTDNRLNCSSSMNNIEVSNMYEANCGPYEISSFNIR